MFLILVYDIGEKRVNKVLKTARKYLYWVQNSVLEGELTNARYRMLSEELKRIIKKDEDSVIFYTFRCKQYTSRDIIGIDKGGMETFI